MACVLWLASKLLRGVLSLRFLSTVGTGLVPRGSVFLGLCSNQQTSYFSGHESWWLLWCWRSWDHRSQGLDLWTQPGQHWTMLWVQPLLSFQNLICVHIAQAYALRNKHTHPEISFFFLRKSNSCFLHVLCLLHGYHISTSFSLWSSHLNARHMKAVSVFHLLTRRRRSNLSVLKEINPKYSSEGLMLKLKLQYFGHLMERADSSEKTLILGKIEGRKRRGRQDKMAGWHHRLNGHEFEQTPGDSEWSTGKPGVPQSMRLQRVGRNVATEHQKLEELASAFIKFDSFLWIHFRNFVMFIWEPLQECFLP